MAFDFHHSANFITLIPTFPLFFYILSHGHPPSVIQIEKFGVMLDFFPFPSPHPAYSPSSI